MANQTKIEGDAPRILVVDDETAVQHVLKTLLTRKGCDVTAAGSAEEASQLLLEFQPEVVLTDIVMPKRSGIELLAEIKRRSPDTEVVLMTSYGSVETAIKAIRRGAYDYLQKPFPQLEGVWLTVQRALEKRRLARQVGAFDLERAHPSRQISRLADQLPPLRGAEAPETDADTGTSEDAAVPAGDRES